MSAKYFLSLVVLSSFFPDIFAHDNGRAESRIVGVFGGKPTARGEWPWLVALFHTEYDRFFCAGSLISAMHVLSGEVTTRESLDDDYTIANS